MDPRYIFAVFTVITLCSSAHVPAVYENTQNQTDNSEKYNPTIFNFKEYQKVTQQNPQIVRYQQQQEADKQHPHRQARLLNSEMDQSRAASQESEIKIPIQSSWKIIHPKFVNENQNEKTPIILIGKNLEKPKVKIDKILTGNEDSLNNRKSNSKSESYLVNEDVSNPAYKEDRQDIGDLFLINSNDIAFGKQKNMQDLSGYSISTTQDSQIQALNSLIGQTPSLQLQGLQQLLNQVKDHVPIKEDVVDIPNTQIKPNIKVEHAPNNINNNIQTFANSEKLNSLQAQLDATANAHAQSIIAQAQHQALEHVKAQHEAIARAQVEAEKKALAAIEAQNRELTKIHALAEAKRLADIERELQVQRNAVNQLVEENKATTQGAEEIKLIEDRRLNEGKAQQTAGEYLNVRLDDPTAVAQKTRTLLHQHRKYYQHQQNNQQLQQQPSETQQYYSQAYDIQKPQPFQSNPTYTHQNSDLIETKVIYQHIKPKDNIRKDAHYQADSLKQPQSHRYQHLQPHHESQLAGYGKGNEQDVTKYYIQPELKLHNSKNIHGENEVSSFKSVYKREVQKYNESDLPDYSFNQDYDTNNFTDLNYEYYDSEIKIDSNNIISNITLNSNETIAEILPSPEPFRRRKFKYRRRRPTYHSNHKPIYTENHNPTIHNYKPIGPTYHEPIIEYPPYDKEKGSQPVIIINNSNQNLGGLLGHKRYRKKRPITIYRRASPNRIKQIDKKVRIALSKLHHEI